MNHTMLWHIYRKKEFDFFIDLHLTAGRTNEHWQLYKNKNSYKRIFHPEKFDYFVAPDGMRDIYKLYHLPFRIIKIQLEDNVFETICTLCVEEHGKLY